MPRKSQTPESAIANAGVSLEEVAPKPTCIPPVVFQRNEHGLLSHINYVFKEDGQIDWRKMVKPEFLFPNKDRTNETDVSKIEDKDLLISLAGLKELARIRGYSSVKHTPIPYGEVYVLTETTINWIPNFETEGRAISFSDCADAHPNNTKSFNRNYLAANATNRSFARAVRNFLGINICSQEEVGTNETVEGTTEKTGSNFARTQLQKVLDENKVKFEQFKNRMIKQEIDGAIDWNSIEDVPEDKSLDLILLVKELIKKKKESEATGK